MRHRTCAKATDATSAKTSNATAATHVTSAKATHVTAAKAAPHVASAKPTTVSSAAATTAAGLCTRCKKAAGKHRACQNHHHSSSHDILHWGWADFPPQDLTRRGLSQQVNANAAMNWRWRCLSVVSTKFHFNQSELSAPNLIRSVRQ
jgi:hypothetical protein